jgi:hypothetical protein
MPDEVKPPDAWERISKVANMLAIVAIPVVLGVYGNVVSQSIKDKELGLAYVELAVSILVDDPVDGSEDDKALRRWASDILGEYSGVTLTAQAQNALLNRQLPSRLLLSPEALNTLAVDRDRFTAARPTRPAAESPDDGMVISKDVLRALSDNELRRLGIDRAAVERRNNQ